MMIVHRRKRWYWPFKTIYLKHDKKASEHCLPCLINDIIAEAKHGTTISPTKKDLDFMLFVAYSHTEIYKQILKAAAENEDQIMKENKEIQ
ncbi:hypothetical protein LCGC14_0601830 [marine sediment metagenome]|uniref:Uncharacterized protein n=1 Tax=marine sediment metagenome TaxID=412755 RepID=A0A0F9TWD8_9ZZZZ